MTFLIGLGLGIVVGGLIVIIFSKNNKKHIEAARSQVIDVANKVEEEVKKQIK
jgi:hypothetical protein